MLTLYRITMSLGTSRQKFSRRIHIVFASGKNKAHAKQAALDHLEMRAPLGTFAKGVKWHAEHFDALCATPDWVSFSTEAP